MQADDDLSSSQQLAEHAEALQHDVEQAEHHRQAVDDERDPCDTAEDDLVEFVRKHRAVLLDFDVCLINNRAFVGCDHSDIAVFDAGTDRVSRRIPLDPSGDRSS